MHNLMIKIADNVALKVSDIRGVEYFPKEQKIKVRYSDSGGGNSGSGSWTIPYYSKRRFNKLIKDINDIR